MRTAVVERNTGETRIKLTLNIDGKGEYNVDTGCGFLNHMLELFARHAGFDLDVKCNGDTYVDFHHTVEDVGIVLGSALKQALGDCRGINRYGSFLLPMDESLVLCALDISGRSSLVYNLDIPAAKVGDFDTELTEEFFTALCRSADITLHLKQLDGKNSHHIIEAAFKGFARALKGAVMVDSANADKIPSTKGVL